MPLATVDEIARGWRSLDDDEKANAEDLIAAAEAWIRDPGRRPDIADGDPLAKRVVVEVVRTAIGPEGDWHNHTSYTDTMGPLAQGGSLATPAGLLLFTATHAAMLGISASPSPRYRFDDERDRQASW